MLVKEVQWINPQFVQMLMQAKTFSLSLIGQSRFKGGAQSLNPVAMQTRPNQDSHFCPIQWLARYLELVLPPSSLS